MVTFRRLLRIPREAPPDRSGVGRASRRRWVGIFTLTTAVTLCALTLCALLTPMTVFGAQASEAARGTSLAGSSRGVVAMAAEAVGAAAATLGSSSTLSAGTLLTTLPWGAGPGQVGLAQPSEGLTRGPEALAVTRNGRIAVLDSVNKRVLFLGSAGQVTGSFDVPLDEPRFLAVSDARVYVLDCDSSKRLIMFDWTGCQYCTAALPALPDVVTGLFATSGGPCVEVAHSQVFRIGGAMAAGTVGDFANAGRSAAMDTNPPLTGLSGRPLDSGSGRFARATFAPGTFPLASTFVSNGASVAGKMARLDLAVPAGRRIDSLVSVDGDVGGGLVVGARLLDTDPSQRRAVLVLRRFNLAGDGSISTRAPSAVEKDSLTLVDWSTAYVGQPYVVAPDCRVFQPVATDAGYSIFVHSFGNRQATTQGEVE